MKTKRTRDNDVAQRMAAFVKGRTNIPREMFYAAFPKSTTNVVSILTALGYLEPGRRPHEQEAFIAGRDAFFAKRRAAKVERLKAQIAELEAK